MRSSRTQSRDRYRGKIPTRNRGPSTPPRNCGAAALRMTHRDVQLWVVGQFEFCASSLPKYHAVTHPRMPIPIRVATIFLHRPLGITKSTNGSAATITKNGRKAFRLVAIRTVSRSRDVASVTRITPLEFSSCKARAFSASAPEPGAPIPQRSKPGHLAQLPLRASLATLNESGKSCST